MKGLETSADLVRREMHFLTEGEGTEEELLALAPDAIARTELMSQITVGRSSRFTIPSIDFAGSPVGIDARFAAELGITPQITTGVLHATSGAGQIGAGVAHQPVEPFRAAVVALADELDLLAEEVGPLAAKALK